MTDPSALPVQLHLAGRSCVVVGGGRVGRRRAVQLADAGAKVVVVEPAADDQLRAVVAEHPAVQLVERAFRADDAEGAFLVVAATDDTRVNSAVGEAARSAGALVNRADDAVAGDLDLAGVLRRGPLTVSVGTDGQAPVVTRWALERLDESLDDVLGLDADGMGLLVQVVAEVRAELAAERAGDRPAGAPPVTPGPPDWRSALDRTMLDLINSGRKAQAKERLQACLSSS